MADQRCLVCSNPTKHAHLAVLICRACKIFYRRSEKKRVRPLVCQANKGKCRKSPDCKKCRYDTIEQLVKGVDDKSSVERVESPEDVSTTTAEMSSPENDPILRMESPDNRVRLMDRVRIHYRTMSISRRAAELSELHRGILPCSFNQQHPLKPATFTSLNYSMRLLVTALFDFAANVFDEFSDLSQQNKWFLIKNFHHPFWTLESAYRVLSQFPHLDNFHFTSQTTYLNDESAASFNDLTPRTPRAKEDARDLLRSFLGYDTRLGLNAVRKARISEEEFEALLVLSFWNIENTSIDDDSLIALAVQYRCRVLAELQEMYRRKGTEEECAKRIGVLMGIVVVLQDLSYQMPMNMEMFRLLDVLDENCTMYQLNVHGIPGSLMHCT